MLTIKMPPEFHIGATYDCILNGDHCAVTWKDKDHLILVDDDGRPDERRILFSHQEVSGDRTFYGDDPETAAEVKARAIERQRETFALPRDAAFHQSFKPHGEAVDLLARIAASSSEFAAEAGEVLAHWRAGLATPEQMAVLEANSELEVGVGAVTSPSKGKGYWLSTWSWTFDPNTDET